jgi:hypothetical protein
MAMQRTPIVLFIFIGGKLIFAELFIIEPIGDQFRKPGWLLPIGKLLLSKEFGLSAIAAAKPFPTTLVISS